MKKSFNKESVELRQESEQHLSPLLKYPLYDISSSTSFTRASVISRLLFSLCRATLLKETCFPSRFLDQVKTEAKKTTLEEYVVENSRKYGVFFKSYLEINTELC